MPSKKVFDQQHHARPLGRLRPSRRGATRRAVLVAGATLTAAPFLVTTLASGAGASTPGSGARAATMVRVEPASRPLAGSRALGAVAASAAEKGAVVLEPRDTGALQAFLANLTDKHASGFGHYLAPGEFIGRFGPTAATEAKVESFLATEGLHVTGVDGLLVNFSGSASHVERAFHTGLESYRLSDGTLGQGTTAAIDLPSTIAPSVTAVIGLDNLVRYGNSLERAPVSERGKFPSAKAPRFTHPAGSPDPCAAAVGGAEINGGLTDDQIANSYGAFRLYGEGDFGAGQHIAVYELEPFLAADVLGFDRCYFGDTKAKVMAASLHLTNVDGNLPGNTLPAGPGSGESILDIEDVEAIASDATVDVYDAPNSTYGSIDEYATIVDNDADDIVTTSWGECEQALQEGAPGEQQAENEIFEQAAAQGQTVLNAAGDTGDDTCNGLRATQPPPDQNVLSQDDPGSQPYVMSVGGTTIDDATQPAAEHVWNDGAEWGGGGGGPSESWTMPSWQRQLITSSSAMTSANVTAMKAAEQVEAETGSAAEGEATPTFCANSGPAAYFCREVPDVTAQADQFTGAVTIYTVLDFPFAPDGWSTEGGTSSATPIWAAMLALVNASQPCHSDDDVVHFANGNLYDIGFASPILYGLAAIPTDYAASFNDIKVGDNDVYGLDDGAVFPASTGYDMASGLGSPQLTSATGNHNGLAFYACAFASPTGSAPTVASLTVGGGPGVLPVAGGTVVIKGTGFEIGTSGSPAPDVAAIEIGGAQLLQTSSDFTVDSGTQITATFPPASAVEPAGSPQDGAGPAGVIVTLASGQSSEVTSAATIQYVDENGSSEVLPSVTGVSSYGGLASDPAQVTVWGSGFAGGDTVSFGGKPGTGVTVVSAYEITVTPPALDAADASGICPVDVADDISPTADACQTELVVHGANGPSSTDTILPPYEGQFAVSGDGVVTPPPGCGCELAPQPTEYDYFPAPHITGVSSDAAGHCRAPLTQAECNQSLASEEGSTEIAITGVGFDPLSLAWVDTGPQGDESSETGTPLGITSQTVSNTTTMTVYITAPATVSPLVNPLPGAMSLPVEVAALTGTTSQSNDPAAITYAGLPAVTAVSSMVKGAHSLSGLYGAQDDVPTPVLVRGAGLGQAFTIAAVDAFSPYSVGTQYALDFTGGGNIETDTVSQNPAIVDVEVCSVTGCSLNPNTDLFVLYPPGKPDVTSASVRSGPAHGGTTVTLGGVNLGCAIGVTFGSADATRFANAVQLLDCGDSNSLTVTSPAAPLGHGAVPVRVETFECFYTACNSASSVGFTYTKSTPSAPLPITYRDVRGSVEVSWNAPASTGGSAITSYTLVATSPGRSPVVVRNLSATGLDYTLQFLQPGVPWTFTVYAVSRLGQGLGATSTPAAVLPPADNGYLIATSNGAVFGFGALSSSGGPGGGKLASPIVGIAATPDGLGYFEAAANGTVYHFGDAASYGSASVGGSVKVVGIAATPDGKGYWLVTNSGDVYAYGDARYYGAVKGASDVVGIASTPDGLGYFVDEANGAAHAFGNAVLRGDMAGKHLNKPLVGVEADPANGGYWLVGGDGGVFSFGGAPYLGSMIGKHLNEGAVGMVAAPDGRGYWLVAADGGVFSFGDTRYLGNPFGEAQSPSVGIATSP